jgi:hypothetical protein
VSALEAAVSAITPLRSFIAKQFGVSPTDPVLSKSYDSEEDGIAAAKWDEQHALEEEPGTANASPQIPETSPEVTKK